MATAPPFKVLGYGHTVITVRSSKSGELRLALRHSLTYTARPGWPQEAELYSGAQHSDITENQTLNPRLPTVPDSLRFWKDIFGLPVLWQLTVPSSVPGDPTHTITGAPAGAVMHVTWLGLPQRNPPLHAGGSGDPGHVSALELIQYELAAGAAGEQASRTPRARSWDVGALHVNLLVRGLDAIIERVKAEGWGVYSGIFTVPQESPEKKSRGQRICYLSGPDGEMVELTEIPGKE